ncbi:MAG: hypothetical protein NHB15_16170 [Methanosarcina barkeri]|nr:hypothetical protein [Methanosarcina sp. ERenArc_MAG2]
MVLPVEAKLGAHAELSMRSLIPLSKNHLICACLCANGCKEIEQEFIDGNTIRNKDDLHQENIAYACGAVISSVAFMESTINEFFQNFFYTFDKLNITNSELMDLKSKWEINEEKFMHFKLEQKYDELAYKKILNKELDKNNKSWDDFKNLITLRNSLVHFRAKWQTDIPKRDDPYKIIHLRKRFKQNPFVEGTDNLDFPKGVLCAGCAIWSIDASTRFVTMFSKDLSDSDIGINLRTNVTKILQQYSIK